MLRSSPILKNQSIRWDNSAAAITEFVAFLGHFNAAVVPPTKALCCSKSKQQSVSSGFSITPQEPPSSRVYATMTTLSPSAALSILIPINLVPADAIPDSPTSLSSVDIQSDDEN